MLVVTCRCATPLLGRRRGDAWQLIRVVTPGESLVVLDEFEMGHVLRCLLVVTHLGEAGIVRSDSVMP
jgi:hypothetical protein